MNNIIYQHIFHIILFAELIAGLLLWGNWGIKNKDKAGYSIAPVLFFFNALLYTSLSIFGSLDGTFLQNWADIVSIHGVSILIMGVIAMLYSETSSFVKGNKNGKH